MLREKLVVIGGDLVVAKSRVRELEMNLLDDKLSLKKSAETLLESSGFFFDTFLNFFCLSLHFISRPGWLRVRAY